MLAETSTAGLAWTSAIGVVVFVGALVAVAVDRVRLQRRLAAVERSEALLETDLADARRQLDDLRRCLASSSRAAAQPSAGAAGTAG